MSNIVHLHIPVALLGRWRSEEEDARSEYVISQEDGSLTISGFDFVDGEEYVISGIEYDRDKVSFDTLMPSTGRRGHIILRALAGLGRAEQTFTFTNIVEVTRLNTGQ